MLQVCCAEITIVMEKAHEGWVGNTVVKVPQNHRPVPSVGMSFIIETL